MPHNDIAQFVRLCSSTVVDDESTALRYVQQWSEAQPTDVREEMLTQALQRLKSTQNHPLQYFIKAIGNVIGRLKALRKIKARFAQHNLEYIPEDVRPPQLSKHLLAEFSGLLKDCDAHSIGLSQLWLPADRGGFLRKAIENCRFKKETTYLTAAAIRIARSDVKSRFALPSIASIAANEREVSELLHTDERSAGSEDGGSTPPKSGSSTGSVALDIYNSEGAGNEIVRSIRAASRDFDALDTDRFDIEVGRGGQGDLQDDFESDTGSYDNADSVHEGTGQQDSIYADVQFDPDSGNPAVGILLQDREFAKRDAHSNSAQSLSMPTKDSGGLVLQDASMNLTVSGNGAPTAPITITEDVNFVDNLKTLLIFTASVTCVSEPNHRLTAAAISGLLSRYANMAVGIVDSSILQSFESVSFRPRARLSFQRYRTLLLPFHDHILQHWSLFVYEREDNSLSLYDSASLPTCTGSLAVQRFLAFVNGRDINVPTPISKKCRQQTDTVSCGLYVVANARDTLFGGDITQPLDIALARKEFAGLLATSAKAGAEVLRSQFRRSSLSVSRPRHHSIPYDNFSTGIVNTRERLAAHGHLLQFLHESHQCCIRSLRILIGDFTSSPTERDAQRKLQSSIHSAIQHLEGVKANTSKCDIFAVRVETTAKIDEVFDLMEAEQNNRRRAQRGVNVQVGSLLSTMKAIIVLCHIFFRRYEAINHRLGQLENIEQGIAALLRAGQDVIG